MQESVITCIVFISNRKYHYSGKYNKTITSFSSFTNTYNPLSFLRATANYVSVQIDHYSETRDTNCKHVINGRVPIRIVSKPLSFFQAIQILYRFLCVFIFNTQIRLVYRLGGSTPPPQIVFMYIPDLNSQIYYKV